MTYYIPWPSDSGGYAVAYMNHNGELCAVLDCPTFQQAHSEAQAMTRRALMQSVTPPAKPSGGNRYLRDV